MNVRQYNGVKHSFYSSVYPIVVSDIHFTALITSLFCLTFILLLCLPHCIVWHSLHYYVYSFYCSVYHIILSDIHFTALFIHFTALFIHFSALFIHLTALFIQLISLFIHFTSMFIYFTVVSTMQWGK
jgi:hypothetical protein